MCSTSNIALLSRAFHNCIIALHLSSQGISSTLDHCMLWWRRIQNSKDVLSPPNLHLRLYLLASQHSALSPSVLPWSVQWGDTDAGNIIVRPMHLKISGIVKHLCICLTISDVFAWSVAKSWGWGWFWFGGCLCCQHCHGIYISFRLGGPSARSLNKVM